MKLPNDNNILPQLFLLLSLVSTKWIIFMKFLGKYNGSKCTIFVDIPSVEPESPSIFF